jgi:hypothetical protein
VRRTPRAKPERARLKVGFEDRLNDDLDGRLHDAVAYRGNRQRPQLVAARLGDKHPPRRQRAIAAVSQVRLELAEQAADAVALDLLDGLPVDAGRAAIAAHLAPRPLQDVPAEDLVMKRVETSPGIGLGRPV